MLPVLKYWLRGEVEKTCIVCSGALGAEGRCDGVNKITRHRQSEMFSQCGDVKDWEAELLGERGKV